METLCAVVEKPADTDEIAEKSLGMLVPGLLKCKFDKGDTEARLRCQLGSVGAMTAAIRGVELGASHGIGHQVWISFLLRTMYASADIKSWVPWVSAMEKQAVFFSQLYASLTPSITPIGIVRNVFGSS